MIKPKAKSKAMLKKEAASAARSSHEADVATALALVETLQESRLRVERELAKHTGIFGWSWTVMSDPENERRLVHIKKLIVEAKAALAETEKALEPVAKAITKRKA